MRAGIFALRHLPPQLTWLLGGNNAVNIELIAIQIGDAVKYRKSVNEIDRVAKAVFQFPCQEFPNESITSERAQLIYDWIMSLEHYSFFPGELEQLLIYFVKSLTHDEINLQHTLLNILNNYGIGNIRANENALERFDSYQFHLEIIEHCRALYGQENYFHAVFEAAKVYNSLVKSKAQSTEDGASLMFSAWNPQNGVLKVNACTSETDRNVQDGIKFLSVGLMSLIRNPTAHEPALQWPIDEQDAIDILSLVSFLLRQYDKAVYSP
jgi:uncharacterized protein (TIGR02391 family)